MSKGRDPQTRLEAQTLVESGHLTKIDPKDFQSQKLSPNAYPVVLGFNGRDHYFPTVPSDLHEFNEWKVVHQVGPLLTGVLMAIEQVDFNDSTLTQQKKQSLQTVKTCILQNLPTISKHSHTTYQAKTRQCVGPVFSNPGSQAASSVPADPEARSSHLPHLPPTSSTTQHDSGEKTKGKGKRKKYICQYCGEGKDRKPDLTGHLWTKHNVGDPIICTLGECAGKSYSTMSSLRQHKRTIHSGKYNYNCNFANCKYGTESKDQLLTHKTTKHGITLLSRSTNKEIIYKCKKCKKTFKGPSRLKRHMREGMCLVKKTIPCGFENCKRKFKTRLGRERHVGVFHRGDDKKKLTCYRCKVKLANKGSMANHQKYHRYLDSIRKAKNKKTKSKVSQSVPA